MHDRLTEVSGLVYGTHVHGRVPADFRAYMLPFVPEDREAVDTLQINYDVVDEVPRVDEIWESEPGGQDTAGRLTLSREPHEGFGLTVCGDRRGYFRCTAETIDVRWSSPGPREAAAYHLFSHAFPLWLETRGIPVLHGSAVALEGGRAVGFVGPTGIGKSVLSAELVELGCGFLADDGLALRRGNNDEWRCLAGPPMLRLWPSGLTGRLGIEPETLPKVVEMGEKRRRSVACAGKPALPLAALYVLRRRSESDGPVELTRCRPRQALVRFLEHGVAASPATALGLAIARFELLADLAETVPMAELAYPGGTDSSARILDAIERDL